MSVEIGQKAPDFTITANSNETVSLSSLLGKKVVLYFYPKDDTPGCTTEAKDFTTLIKDFNKTETIVLGVSKDTVAKHQKFIAKHSLEVTLLSDEEGKTIEDYGVWVEKNMYGKKYMGIERATFLIDRQGVVNNIWRKVKVKGHAETVLDAAKAIT
ncbi:thioredoxin-dependent thiol peroxidase [Kordiimonas pumila]|uniref:thioredoxin-dependent peroxiredoxin n=1 Tax=Kordiimonas pumila TaxID=2161677 RepID=A0ABV7D1R5_9PROT|nr:thioredoxin-dependent thiol peroxidase [Kordiimonas pumila]